MVRRGDGSEIRDYINVLDAARASVNLLTPDREPDYIMLTGNRTYKVRDILKYDK